MSKEMENHQRSARDRDLDDLLAAYREACPDREAGPNFMPGVWMRIDAQRNFTRRLGRWAQACMTAAAAICLLLSLWVSSPGPVFHQGTYVEMLENDDAPETMVYSEVSLIESRGEGLHR